MKTVIFAAKAVTRRNRLNPTADTMSFMIKTVMAGNKQKQSKLQTAVPKPATPHLLTTLYISLPGLEANASDALASTTATAQGTRWRGVSTPSLRHLWDEKEGESPVKLGYRVQPDDMVLGRSGYPRQVLVETCNRSVPSGLQRR